MQALLGIIFHFIGGFSSGSFYIPFKKVKGWAWENYWIVGGLFSWLVVPPLAAYLTIANFADIIAAQTSAILQLTFLMGILGYWRADLWLGGSVFGYVVRQLGSFRLLLGIWFIITSYLL